MKGLMKKIASSSVILVMALSVMIANPLYSDSQSDVQDVSPLIVYDPEKPVEN